MGVNSPHGCGIGVLSVWCIFVCFLREEVESVGDMSEMMFRRLEESKDLLHRVIA